MMFYLGILLFLLSVSFHEIGHAFAMKRYGVSIKEISLFGIGPKIAKFQLKNFFGEAQVSIGLLPLGAYVKPSTYSSKKTICLSYSQQCHIYGAGVCANFLFSSLLLVCSYLIQGTPVSTNYWIITSASFLIGIFPRYSCHLVLPIGTAFLVLFLNMLIGAPLETLEKTGSIITVADTIKTESVDIVRTLQYGASLSFALGIFNAMPFYPLDGGKIFSCIAGNIAPEYKKNIWKIVGWVTGIPLLFLIFWSLKNDILRILSY